jgi:DUF1680 family protein
MAHLRPALDRPSHGRWELEGFLGARLRAAVEGWLLPAPHANPSMLRVFRDRDRLPRRKLVPWAGEFVGKHLTASVYLYELTRDARLYESTRELVRSLISVQDTDGYLGPHPRAERLTGKNADGHDLWDVWGHYHCIFGLILWNRLTGHEDALACARRAADLLCRTFLDTGTPLTKAGAEEMNMAVIHAFCLLHDKTGEPRYLAMAQRIERDWEIPPAGDYLRAAQAGREFYQCPKPRWESLHDLLALPELYWTTGDGRYRAAFEHYWWSIAKGDRHNTGGFTSGEQAVGNPYAGGAIETCCTVAWIAMTVEMLRMTGDARAADELELATFNGSLGGQHPSGRWWTYNTPMDGVKLASAHDIVFQAHAGGPELNCCSVNAPRGPGMLSEWALMTGDGGLCVSYYGPGTLEADLPGAGRIRLRERTTYPRSGDIRIEVAPERPGRFPLRLRVPQWSAHTTLRVNDEPLTSPRPGEYAAIDREWREGDQVHLELDMSPHFWVGEREQAGKASIYHGPLLLAYDQRFNDFDADAIPVLDGPRLQLHAVPHDEEPAPWLLLATHGEDGRELRLCDFATAGACGTEYRSWLTVRGLEARPFSRERAVWVSRSE